MTKVGFIGLGIMGRPMAGHLIDAGHELSHYSRSKAAPDLAARGKVRSSPIVLKKSNFRFDHDLGGQ